jgi:hypothetical protein
MYKEGKGCLFLNGFRSLSPAIRESYFAVIGLYRIIKKERKTPGKKSKQECKQARCASSCTSMQFCNSLCFHFFLGVRVRIMSGRIFMPEYLEKLCYYCYCCCCCFCWVYVFVSYFVYIFGSAWVVRAGGEAVGSAGHRP